MMKSIARSQVVLVLWVALPFFFAAINSIWLEPNNIWVNNSGAGLPSTSVVLGIPIFFLFNVYYLILKPFVAIESGGSGAWLQIVPDTNPFGTILIGSLILLTLAAFAFFIGRAVKDRAWEKYVFYGFTLFILFDAGNYAYQALSAVQAKPVLDSRAETIKICNGTAPEYTTCQTRCSTEWSALAAESAEKRNAFWTTCTAKCDPLQAEFQTKCLRESGLPEYQDFPAQ